MNKKRTFQEELENFFSDKKKQQRNPNHKLERVRTKNSSDVERCNKKTDCKQKN